MAHLDDRCRKAGSSPIHKICAFAIFSTRRQEEIVTIKWNDLEECRVLIRDMKHPGEKTGNDVLVEPPPEAEAIIKTMNRCSDRIFPFTTSAISA